MRGRPGSQLRVQAPAGRAKDSQQERARMRIVKRRRCLATHSPPTYYYRTQHSTVGRARLVK